jgi:hypothetical protein
MEFSSEKTSTTSALWNNPSISIFPSTFGIYRPTTKPHLVLAHSSKTISNPLFYISIRSSFSSKPDIVLHHGSSKAHPSLASAQFKGFFSTSYITLNATNYAAASIEPLRTEGFFHTVHYFSLYLPKLGKRERFEWKISHGAEVKALGHGSGMKLIRVKTEEVVVVFVHVSLAIYKKGKMSFVKTGKGEELGDEWRTMAVMTLLTILEEKRKSSDTSAGVAGAAGGAWLL